MGIVLFWLVAYSVVVPAGILTGTVLCIQAWKYLAKAFEG